jgi:hypothetical protein
MKITIGENGAKMFPCRIQSLKNSPSPKHFNIKICPLSFTITLLFMNILLGLINRHGLKHWRITQCGPDTQFILHERAEGP